MGLVFGPVPPFYSQSKTFVDFAYRVCLIQVLLFLVVYVNGIHANNLTLHVHHQYLANIIPAETTTSDAHRPQLGGRQFCERRKNRNTVNTR